MLRNDPAIRAGAALQARMFQAMFPVMRRLMYSSSELQFATRTIDKPRRITVPTRRGKLPTLIYAPLPAEVARQLAVGAHPPVHLITHGGAFIIRVPEQEDNVARYLASEVGAFVVIPDYDTAPYARFPVAEYQTYDVYRWVCENAGGMGWDGRRVSVGGASAGGKLALNVALQAIDGGYQRPVALTSEYGLADLTIADESRTSDKRSPVVGPRLMKLVRETYFAGADLSTPLASPALHPRLSELPPTLILTAEHDTLRHDSGALARDLAAKQVPVSFRQFAGVDHGFTHAKPVEAAREAVRMIGEHLAAAYTIRK
jgi:acetyl esterase